MGDLMVQAKISTMKTIGKEYEKHYHNLTLIGEEKQIKYLIDKFTSVMEILHGLEASVKQEEETKKKKLALAKSETLESMKLEKFSGQGDNKYLKYYIWYTEFSELVMKKEYSDNVKLKFLKQYTEKDAHDLVKNYHHSQELATAFETLDEHYGKPSMVIRESLRNLRMIETVKSINDVKSNRALISKINTNISTLRCYNFDLEGDDIENSSFLIEMEKKIPYNTIQYNTIQYNTIQYNTIIYNNIQYKTIQNNTIQYNTIQYNTIQYNTIQYKAIQYNTIQYNTVQYNTIQYNTIQCNTIQYNTIQYNTIQYNTI